MLRELATATALAFAMGTLTAASTALSAAGDTPELIYRNGRFEPSVLSIPAGKTIKLRVTNSSASEIEFESFDLNRERVVAPGRSITVYLPSLSPGTYHFFDDFHHGSGEGTISAR